MNDEQFHAYQLGLFGAFSEQLASIASREGGEGFAPLAEHFTALTARPGAIPDEGPALVARLFTTAPQLGERFPRELLWYLGGECLHFMPDEEIDALSALDDERRASDAAGLPFSWQDARAAALGLQ